jgi:hypothetical protein
MGLKFEGNAGIWMMWQVRPVNLTGDAERLCSKRILIDQRGLNDGGVNPLKR